MCADFFLRLLADFIVTKVFSPSSALFFVFFCLDDESEHSALGSAEHFSCSFAVAHVPVPHVIAGVSPVDDWRMRTKCIGS